MSTPEQLNAGVEAALDAVSRREDALAALHAAALEGLAEDVARRLRAMPLVASAWDGQEPDALLDQLRRQAGAGWALAAHRKASRLLGSAFREVMKSIGKPLGVRFDLANPLLAHAFESLTAPATFEEGAWESVRSSLQESHDAGRSIPEAAADLRTEAGISSATRGRTIARTELVGMVNAGSLAAVRITKAAGFKQWLATSDDRTRRTHRAAGGQVRPIDDTFTVGGYDLDYPGDFRAPARERVNCRCTMVFTDNPTGFTGEQGRSALLGPSSDWMDLTGMSDGAARFGAERALGHLDRILIPARAATARKVHGYTLPRGNFNSAEARLERGRPVAAVGVTDRFPEPEAATLFAHEVGHAVDFWRGVDLDPGATRVGHRIFSSERGVRAASPAMRAFMSEVKATPEWRQIKARTDADGPYYRRPREVWARAFAQWVALESGDAEMAAVIGRARGGLQWGDDSWRLLAPRVREVLREAGWVR